MHKNQTILAIGDCHVEVGESIERFKWLGQYILKAKPDIIVIIGDFLSLDCLSSWDKNKRLKMEGLRYAHEIDLGKLALKHMFKPMKEYNKKRREQHKSGYQPRFVFVEGNHENRLPRYLEEHPELEGTMDIYEDLQLELLHAQWVSYDDYLEIEGIQFCHIPFAKNGRPIGRMHICKQALELSAKSVVFGHTHKGTWENMYRIGAEHLQQALNIGCFFEHQPDYVAGAPSDYWRGVMLLETYDYQRFDFSTVSLSRLRAEYG
tara:strand:- start:33 stop:821 length:789 start_codon:yes stop_codon:yes gene_type:complete